MEKKAQKEFKMVWMLKSLLASYIVTTLLLLLVTLLLYKFDLDEQKVQIGIMAVYVLSTLAGGFIIGKLVRVRRFLWGLILGVLYFVLLLLISIGVYRTVQGGTNMIISCVLCGAGGMLGGMLS
ncbi:TIGR04086 family membrane protein [Bariatricus massiliensis]|uniref:TIGR04086 family membrane protein n=1 Tax=Bariatricus massiliensis TaxID=1745713 RepID=A0ABS8DF11_9FIRM|nr:TIGR04086 family membrane protein [Bariatricus massiliensis]MCB7303102.1 TIGR04086 family membrane protein [Bariatricus massiliensis]MCB7374318.1 TIGR04086 family membrane protein [Bariatricus massiliensis]MCB7386988.1 TIGR04086 family membrane protein [Bariatricus massiliensis]MCB7411150.1 TIGR04086 family membrane protein [Bariatricus massiliensis]MCQ5251976.1 TIGR04086 family membrane protein [Bariatricus massiliensis]